MLLEALDVLLTLLPDWQAGGGGRFGTGGGGFGGGGGGDGDGIFFVLYFLLRLAVEAPLIGIPLLLLVVFVFVKGSRKGWWKHQENVIRRRRPEVRRRTSAREADVLRASDPAFDEAGFLERVRLAFEKAQASWCAQELEPLRAFATDGVFERFSMQIEEQRQDGWRQGLADLRLGPLSIAQVQSGRQFETVTVLIPFQADIHRLDLARGGRIPGSKIPRTSFSECWSFVRRRGARTGAQAGLIEGQCPNCGAPLAMNQSARCGSCEALVRSGEHDWVLAEITQGSEWRPETQEELAGLAPYAASDPGLSVQLLEDRASVAFWRKAAADRRGDAEPLVRIADANFCAAYAESLRVPEGRDRLYSAENAVGSVRTLGLLPGAEQDRAVVELLWDGCRARVGPDGRRSLESSRHLQRALFVFQRPTGATTPIEETFTTTLCRNCGAHDSGGTDPRCPYCDAPRTGPAWVWLLHEIVPDRSAAAEELRRSLRAHERRPQAPEPAPSRASSADLLGWAAELVRADGQLEQRERAALRSLALRNGVSEARLEEMLTSGGESSVAPVPRDTHEARSWLRALVEVALADGSLQQGERRLLVSCAEQLGVGPLELERIVKRIRAELYRSSRAAHRS